MARFSFPKDDVPGIVSGGSPETCRAGLKVLEKGGNAVDAAVAAVCAAFTAELPLTSPAGGGIMLIDLANRDGAIACDFFSDAPGLGLAKIGVEDVDFIELNINFGAAMQRFHVGRGTAAVPGCLVGLLAAHRAFGKIDIESVLEPAIQLARNGCVITPAVAGIMKILGPILTLTPEIRELTVSNGELLTAGSTVANPQLAKTLESVAGLDPAAFYSGTIGDQILERFGPPHGCITREDLNVYKPIFLRPLEVEYRGHRIFTVPPPAAGGTWVDFGLKLLEGLPLAAWGPRSDKRLAAVCGALKLAAERRPAGALRPLYPLNRDWSCLQRELMEFVDYGTEEYLQEAAHREPDLGSTTHVSVVDRDGNTVSVTTSNGESGGYPIGDTGMIMNNFMGEEDINPGGFMAIEPGHRIPTMMAPCLVEVPDGSRFSLGTGGSNRIRSAMIQMLSSLIDSRLSPKDAIDVPRIHYDDSGVYLEVTSSGQDLIQSLKRKFPNLSVFEGLNFFFGGVHVARIDGRTGKLSGTGDPRRGGTTSLELT